MSFSEILFSEIHRHEHEYMKPLRIRWVNGKADIVEV
jgi:hypothetical protein